MARREREPHGEGPRRRRRPRPPGDLPDPRATEGRVGPEVLGGQDAPLGLAHALWTAGRREEAVGHLQDMLRLNPNDNQGVRYTLAGFLLFLDRDDDLARLLRQYPDEASAAWAYTKALLAFRQQGDTVE